MRRMLGLTLLIPLVGAVALSACGDDDGSTSPETTAGPAGDIEIVDPWARVARDDLGAAYFTVVNGTAETVRLTAASSPVAEKVEIHETTMGADGMMSMAEVEGGFEIPSGGELVLEPGGKHLMLLGFTPGESDAIKLTLDFDGTLVVVDARIDREASGMSMGSDSTMAGHVDDIPSTDEMDEMHESNETMADDARLDALLAGVQWVDGDLESILAALDIDALHAVDDDLAAGVLDAEAHLPAAERALAVLQRARWPIDVDPTQLEEALSALVAALESGDVTAAAAAAAAVHEISHDLEPAGHSH